MSKVLKLDFPTDDLKLKPEPPENKVPTAPELMRRIIGNIIFMYTQQKEGLIKMERNQAYWLQGNLKAATEKQALTLEIPDDVFGFLRKIFRETKASPDKLMEMVEGNIDAVPMA